MSLPRLTHLQFAIIARLLRGTRKGRELRDQLREAGVRQSGPAFYQVMAGLEDKGLIEGWYEQQVIDGQIIRERHYKVLSAGRKAWQHSTAFYADALGVPPPRMAYAT